MDSSVPCNTSAGQLAEGDNMTVLTSGDQPASRFGTHEILLACHSAFGNPYTDTTATVTFRRPDGSEATVDCFYDGGDVFKARAYCDAAGTWTWKSSSEHADLDNRSGAFEVENSQLKGKLTHHQADPRQFAYHNGDSFLHIGDTGYRYLVDTEPYWREYLDQAVASGITKIRAWLCRDRSNVKALIQHDRKRLALSYWQQIDRRLAHALEACPGTIFQVIIYGEDTDEVARYAAGDAASRLIAQTAQARWSSLANVTWCISNDFKFTDDMLAAEREGQDTSDTGAVVKGVRQIGRDLLERERWGTLITNHQSRWSGYSFLDEPWTGIVTLEELGQVGGEAILEYRKKAHCPVVNDEDRYESWRPPKHDRYFFRRLMWGSLLSGGHATYGGLKTFEPYDGGGSGMQGYYDACKAGKLEDGAHDFVHIHAFFKHLGTTLAGMIPDDAVSGNQPLLFKTIRSEKQDLFITYLANPDEHEGHAPDRFDGYYSDECADAASSVPSVALALPEQRFTVRWFHPTTGDWSDGGTIPGGETSLRAPGPGDWVVVLES